MRRTIRPHSRGNPEDRTLIFDDLREIQSQYGYLPPEQLQAALPAHQDSAVSHPRRRRFLSALSSQPAAQSADERLHGHVVPSARRRRSEDIAAAALPRHERKGCHGGRCFLPGPMRWRAGGLHQRSHLSQRHHRAGGGAGAHSARRQRTSRDAGRRKARAAWLPILMRTPSNTARCGNWLPRAIGTA